MSIGKLSLWCPSVLHLVHHSSSWTSFPLLMYWSFIVRLANCDWICIIPVEVSLIGEDSNFISIYRDSICNTIFCCINGVQICGNKVTINHYLCCTSNIWNLTLDINVLNLWSKSQTYSIGNYLISLILVMHYDSNFGFMKSSIKTTWMSLSVLGTNPTGTMENFIYQSSAQPRRAVIICDLLIYSS